MRETFMLGLFMLVLTGCNSKPEPEPPPPPQPTIRVERQEDVNGVKVVVWFDNHDYHNHVPCASFTMEKASELKDYKKQLEFALLQIEEVEQRMSVHEPQETKKGEQKEGPN